MTYQLALLNGGIYRRRTKEDEWSPVAASVAERVIIESPYSGDVSLNTTYLAACIRDAAIMYGEAAFASHQMYTGAFDDTCEAERRLGMALAEPWYEVAEYVVVYDDLGISEGMKAGIKRAKQLGLNVIYRQLPPKILEQIIHATS